MLPRLFLTAHFFAPAYAYVCICPRSSDCDVILQPPPTVTARTSGPLENDEPRPHIPRPRPQTPVPSIPWRVSTRIPVPWCILSPETVTGPAVPPAVTLWPTIPPTPASWVIPRPTHRPGLTDPKPPHATQTTVSAATLTATISPAPSSDTTKGHTEVETMKAIPALWAVFVLSVVIFLGWMCWEIWRDVREMLWLEADLKRQREALLDEGGFKQRLAGL